ncbi:MAG: hypothetical protein HKN47_10510 [Pirellulaceae bacterium]|nr:hypothetical protein [Pirellulaceae bacterium]
MYCKTYLGMFLGVLMLGATLPANSFADWRCACGTTVHVNYPTTCPVCSRPLPNPTPPFTPPPSTPPYTPPGTGPSVPPGTPTDSSGLTLGVNIYNAGWRVMVQSVVPGTPAQGKLFPNDQLVKGAFRDAQSGQVFRVNIQSPADVTRLKTLAGAGTRVALQVFRPTTGPRNFFVTFATPGGVTTYGAPVAGGGTAAAMSRTAPAAAMITEDVSGEAASMLGGGATGGGPPVISNPGTNPGFNPGVNPGTNPGFNPPPGGDSAADLLNN